MVVKDGLGWFLSGDRSGTGGKWQLPGDAE